MNLNYTDTTYLEMLEEVMRYGYERTDRTGVGTRSLFGVTSRYDIKTFPLLQSKRLWWRAIVEELLWFLSGSTNAKDLQAKGITIWDEWATKEQCARFGREEGDLGPIYGKQWTCFGNWNDSIVVDVQPRLPSAQSMLSPTKAIGSEQGPWEVVETEVFRDDCGHVWDRVCFAQTGYSYTVRRDQLKRGSVRDPYAASVAGVGYLGEPKAHPLYADLYKVWHHMLERCYTATCKEYQYYGARGVTVCPRWLCFANFLEDASRIHGYYYKRQDPQNVELDKDHYHSNCYSAETCVWLPKRLNTAYAHAKAFEAIDPSGKTYLHISTGVFARLHNLSVRGISRVLRGERSHHKGWSFRYVNRPLLRFCSPVNQITNVIEQIRTNPDSRRLIVSGWNPAEANQVALPPCHTLFQFYVLDGALSCHLYQRSGDIFLGIPYNIASYALLTMMIAHVTGLEPGDLVHTVGDLHLYSNHVAAAKEQLARPRVWESPVVTLNPDKKDIFAFTYEDIVLSNYNPHPAIKADVAV